MKKILLNETFNNGYGCRCCAYNWNHSTWVTYNKYTKIQILTMAINERKKMGTDHLIRCCLEDNGKILFGFDCDIYRIGETLYWINEEGTKTKLAEKTEKITLIQAIKKLGSNF